MADLREAARALATAEREYRKQYEANGGGHRATESAWIAMRQAGDALRTALDAPQGVPSYGVDDLEQATENGARHVVDALFRALAVGSLDAFFARDPEDIVRAAVAEPFKPDPAPQGGGVHPCAKCGVMRTEAEGGTTFTVCDECWDAKHGAPQGGGGWGGPRA